MKKFLLFLLPVILVIIFSGVWFWQGNSQKEGPLIPEDQEGGEVVTESVRGKVLLVIAPQDFRDEEYQQPRKILEVGGLEVAVASKGVKEAKGKFGAKVVIDRDLAAVEVNDYQAVVFIGGPGASIYFHDQTALALAKRAFEKGKVVGAICIAPSILANAGILTGRRATAFSSESSNLQAKGAEYTGELVTVDGKIVTARGPEAAEEFGRKLVEVLGT